MILIKIIIEEPLPKFSFVINSANHIDNMDPVVRDRIIFKAKKIFQLKTTGLTRIKATAVLKISAHPSVKYFVYLVIFELITGIMATP